MEDPDVAVGGGDRDAMVLQQQFLLFLESFTVESDELDDHGNPREFLFYVAKLEPMKNNDLTTLSVDFSHLASSNHVLANAVLEHFYRFQPALNRAVQNFVRANEPDYVHEGRGIAREFYASFYNLPTVDKVRELRSSRVGMLCSVSGTVTRTSEVRPELLFGAFRCNQCENIQLVEQHFKYTPPLCCRAESCNNTKDFEPVIDEHKFVDWQKVRIQENANEIPAGSMPRSLEVILRHEIVEKAKPGDKCIFTGSLIVIPDVSKLRNRADGRKKVGGGKRGNRGDDAGEGVSGLRALGVRDLTYRIAFLASSVAYSNGSLDEEESAEEIQASFTDADREELNLIANQPNLVARMRRSVAPTVFGHEDIKLGVLLMLFGGVHKTTSTKTKLRGDVNICIVGDPSTAKSQFLKYVCSFVPRAIYTSGKASSASGLTASVVRDPDTGEFCIEAGALMLADNGICCIDEFDKMDDVDQVAIHEAMEQQTISITKAGIQATLNARTSVLAAANPIHGRYDRSKTLKANLQLSPAIMSRFDLFFVVLDDCDPAMDRAIADHILDVHQRRIACLLADEDPEDALGNQVGGDSVFTMEQLQKYIRYAKTISPIIPPESQPLLVECYRKLRQGDAVGHNRTAYRITVRQLEALIRLSEALARMHLDIAVRPQHIEWAYRLLRTSIVQVDSADITFDDVLDEPEDIAMETAREIAEAEERAIEPTQVEDTIDPTQLQETEANNPALSEDQLGGTAATTKKKKTKLKITPKEYSMIANMIASHIRQHEESTGNASIRQFEVVQWYLEEQDDITTEDELHAARFKINQIIKRLVKKDSVLIYIDEPDEMDDENKTGSDDDEDSPPPEERKWLMVHPNFAPGSRIGSVRAKRTHR